MNARDRQILQIAVPAIVSNITVPLLGLVDTAIVGHMGSAVYIGAIAVGSMIFNLVYWVFGFLRMGTSGMTAQARGRSDMAEASALLMRSQKVALVVALSLVALQWPLKQLMFFFISPTPDVAPLASLYFDIVIWGAPAMLGLYGLTGWYIGMQNSRIPMFISIMQNVVNIVASLLLVYGMGLKVEGVALGTVIAQYAGFLMAVGLLVKYYRRVLRARSSQSFPSSPSFLRVNRDIFLRTLCLVAVNLCFTAVGARQGAVVLAVNTVMMQMYLLFSYVMDGFAYAGEALGGRYWGASDADAYRDTVHRLFRWGAAMTLGFTAVYVAGGMSFVRLLTDETAVLTHIDGYLPWAWLIPVSGVAAFIWDGIFIGTTQTRGMLLSSFLASVVFFAGIAGLVPLMGNHGLWLSMLLYLLMRGVIQTVLYKLRI